MSRLRSGVANQTPTVAAYIGGVLTSNSGKATDTVNFLTPDFSINTGVKLSLC